MKKTKEIDMEDLLQRYYKMHYYALFTEHEVYQQNDYKKQLKSMGIEPDLKYRVYDCNFTKNFLTFLEWAKGKDFILNVNESLRLEKFSSMNIRFWKSYDWSSNDYSCYFFERINITKDIIIKGEHDTLVIEYKNIRFYNINLMTTVSDFIAEIESSSEKIYGKKIEDVQKEMDFKQLQDRDTNYFQEIKERFKRQHQRIENFIIPTDGDCVKRLPPEKDNYVRGYYDGMFAEDHAREARIASGMYGMGTLNGIK